MTENEFKAIFLDCSEAVADRFYPKSETAHVGGEPSAQGRRGEYLRDQGVLYSKLLSTLIEVGLLHE